MRDSSTRSFSAVNSYGMGDRARREKQRKIMIISISVIMILIALFTVLILGEVFGWFKSEPTPGGDINSGMSLEYEDKLISSSDVHTGDLILINSSFPCVFPETPDNFLSLYSNRNTHDYINSSGENKKVYSYYTQSAENCAKLETETLKALNAWADDFFKATNQIDLFVYDNDGYRSESKQNELYAANSVKYSPAGTTEHHTGKAVDLYIYTMDKIMGNLDDAEFAGTYSWIYQNAHKYGFILRYPSDKADITGVANEPYHFRNVGVAHATYMKQNNLCLEEYLDLIRDNHSYKNEHLKFEGDDGTQYEVYYVKASSDSVTEVPVPKADEEGKISYKISGDNKEGFIVTITLK